MSSSKTKKLISKKSASKKSASKKSASKKTARKKIPQDILTYSLTPFLDNETGINLSKTSTKLYKNIQPTIKKNEYMKLINNNKYHITSKYNIINQFIPFLTYSITNQHDLKIWNFKNNNENKKVFDTLNSKKTQDILIKHKLQYIIHSIDELNKFMLLKSKNINNKLFDKLKYKFNIFSKNSSSFINNSKKVIEYRNIVSIIRQVYYLFKQIIEINDSFIQLDIYNNDVKSVGNNDNFINFIEKHFDIERYTDFLTDLYMDEYDNLDEEILLDELSKNLFIFTDIKNEPLIFYYKNKDSIYYLNKNKNNKLYNTILERLNLL